MTRLAFPDYLSHLRGESARFREVLSGCDPTARVPACPDWDAGDLLWHLAHVQWFWATTMRRRPAGPDGTDAVPDRPTSHTGLLAAFDEFSAMLAGELQTADPAEQAWSWAAEQSVGFTFRRQAHEALIHRLDAEQTAGQVTGLDAALAADGVAELLEVMYGGPPAPWARFEPGSGLVRVVLSDVGVDLWAQPGLFLGTDPESGTVHDGPHLLLLDAPEDGDGHGDGHGARISGTAADLDAWLWKRRDGAGITRTGDEAALTAFDAAVGFPID
ncbi:MAG: maleylpyruvate isomerase family mycothiol-dependent enzyme [Nocardioides sp.]|nr:maleylpyruvate isomerase family mycothiol-dependent enzyme [Nocardioides sp.]